MSSCRRARQAALAAVLAMALGAGPAHPAGVEVEVMALMRDAAVLRVDGKQQLVRTGGTFRGVELVSANPREAVVEVAGRRRNLTISDRIAGIYAAAKVREISIVRNRDLQYRTAALINGHPVDTLVDTGANRVAMSRRDAERLGVNFAAGERAQVATAGGISQGWRVMLESVEVGGIRVSQVPAMVIDGDFPAHVLLGMTFLQHVRLREQDGILYLSSPP